MLLTLIIFLLINVTLAQIDANIFNRHKFIKHGINAIEYGAMIGVPYFIFKDYWLMAALLFMRLIVFNICVSVFSKKKWYYVSPERKAITDKIAFFFFGYRGKLMYSVYLAAFILLICKIYLW